MLACHVIACRLNLIGFNEKCIKLFLYKVNGGNYFHPYIPIVDGASYVAYCKIVQGLQTHKSGSRK